MIAALYVETNGCYYGLPDVDPWDEARDARLYAGPHPVVAHPPCARWGRYWNGGPSARVKRKLGDDGGCFAAALEAVRRWGGVLEHPEASHAWAHHGLCKPPRHGGWVVADFHGAGPAASSRGTTGTEPARPRGSTPTGSSCPRWSGAVPRVTSSGWTLGSTASRSAGVL